MKQTFELMARYNTRMNRAIYGACATLSPAQLAEDRGAFFKSIIGTLNHIAVADLIWLKRFTLHRSASESLRNLIDASPVPALLADILHRDLAELSELRTRLDQAIEQFTRDASPDDYQMPLSYRNNAGVPQSRNFGFLVQHLFNHQTHHRGQVSTLLSQAGVDIGMTDLLAEIPNRAEPSAAADPQGISG